MTDWKNVDKIAAAVAGKTVKRMEIQSFRVTIVFTDDTVTEIEFSHDDENGFAVEATEK